MGPDDVSQLSCHKTVNLLNITEDYSVGLLWGYTMRAIVRSAFVTLLGLSVVVLNFTVAQGQVVPTPSPTPATNLQLGNNTSNTNQAGKGKSGSAVGGQVGG